MYPSANTETTTSLEISSCTIVKAAFGIPFSSSNSSVKLLNHSDIHRSILVRPRSFPRDTSTLLKLATNVWFKEVRLIPCGNVKLTALRPAALHVGWCVRGLSGNLLFPVLCHHILKEFPVIIFICMVIEKSKGLCPSQAKFIIIIAVVVFVFVCSDAFGQLWSQ
mmetsp:Transcript_11277/g.22508  ORF Transcript_11277/g.22508 Transcript_11277/m.22508 type:complete len:165 (+) Transcript_11277:192-686(+)